MHPRNRFDTPHDFQALASFDSKLSKYLIHTPDGRVSLDFSDPHAVRILNSILLRKFYNLQHWDIPSNNLCPGVPGRLDYIHYLADLLHGRAPGIPDNNNLSGTQVPRKSLDSHDKKYKILDIGTGASLIYPILGLREYGWSFVGTDVNPAALKVAKTIIKFNPGLQKKISLRVQPNPSAIFENVINSRDFFEASMCNPPFFSSKDDALSAAQKKWAKLGKPDKESTLNFSGNEFELWTPGGEAMFLKKMIEESGRYADQVKWFTTLVSQAGYLKSAQMHLEHQKVREFHIIPFQQGNKKRRILAWTYI